jgi:haloalkane dehalogenase
MRDWCFRPACLEKFRQIFPLAEVHRLADASHYVVEDACEQIIERMEPFLADAPRDVTQTCHSTPLAPKRDADA